MADPKQTELHGAEHLDEISKLLALASAEAWRRRRLFTELEALQSRLEPSKALKDAFKTAKIGAIHQAFYSEYEDMGGEENDDRPIKVSRDISYLLDQYKATRESVNVESFEGSELRLLDEVPLEFLAGWRIWTGGVFDAFRSSLDAFDSALDGSKGHFSDEQIQEIVDKHIGIVNECLKKTAAEKRIALQLRGSYLDLRFPTVSETVSNLTGYALSFAGPIAGAAVAHVEHADLKKMLIGEAFALVSTMAGASKTIKAFKSSALNRVEARLSEQMETELDQRVR